MKIDTNPENNFVTLELETPSGICNFSASQKSDVQGDRRAWQRDPETLELGQYIQQHNKHSQVVVKCGDNYVKL